VIRLASFALLAAAALAVPRKPPKRTARLVEKGKAVYEIHCIACHGERGEGDGTVAATLNPRPRNFQTEQFRQGSSVSQIFETLGTGVPGTGMAKFPNLSEEERWAVAWYVLRLKNRK
jgi:high-affinity iron transporter